eukprot:scaffold81970_cov22-Tisochrysis_lutea.AAC.1
MWGDERRGEGKRPLLGAYRGPGRWTEDEKRAQREGGGKGEREREQKEREGGESERKERERKHDKEWKGGGDTAKARLGATLFSFSLPTTSRSGGAVGGLA